MKLLSKAKKWLDQAQAVVVTAGNGFAQEEGLDILSEEGFDDNFGRLADRYDVHTIGDALDKKLNSWTEQWTFWSQLIALYSLNYEPSATMLRLKKLLQHKSYFIATSTFAHFFEGAGFAPKQIFDAFGDWTKMQCSSGINHGLRDDCEVARQFVRAAKNKQVTADLVPKCQICNSEMELHMPLNSTFFPDKAANDRFRWFLTKHEDKKLLFLELGVDETSPQLLDPVVKLVAQYPNWHYLSADYEMSDLPADVHERAIAFNSNTHDLVKKLSE